MRSSISWFQNIAVLIWAVVVCNCRKRGRNTLIRRSCKNHSGLDSEMYLDWVNSFQNRRDFDELIVEGLVCSDFSRLYC